MNRVKVYIDTSAYNYIISTYSIEKITPLFKDNFEVYFSSCNLDEFGLCDSSTASKLAAFSWEISNKKKLLDHCELIIMEILYKLRKISELEYFDFSDSTFFEMWHCMINDTFPNGYTDYVKSFAQYIKEGFREDSRKLRKFFKALMEEEGVNINQIDGLSDTIKKYWHIMLAGMESEGWIHEFLKNNLYMLYPDLNKAIDLEELYTIDYRKLKGTAPGIQYYFALYYVQCFQSGELSRPSRGDQADVRHAFYTGIVDYYLTNDERMIEIFNDYILSDHGEIIKADNFINTFQ